MSALLTFFVVQSFIANIVLLCLWRKSLSINKEAHELFVRRHHHVMEKEFKAESEAKNPLANMMALIDMASVLAARQDASANKDAVSYTQEVGMLLGGKVCMRVEFDFSEKNGKVGGSE
jgi:hypothetical protein